LQQQTGAKWVADTTPPAAATPPAARPQGSGPESGQDSEGPIRFG